MNQLLQKYITAIDADTAEGVGCLCLRGQTIAMLYLAGLAERQTVALEKIATLLERAS